MTKAKHLSGHGIDPTIRALIWNQQQHDDTQHDDEDEHESSDVVPTASVTFIPQHN